MMRFYLSECVEPMKVSDLTITFMRLLTQKVLRFTSHTSFNNDLRALTSYSNKSFQLFKYYFIL